MHVKAAFAPSSVENTQFRQPGCVRVSDSREFNAALMALISPRATDHFTVIRTRCGIVAGLHSMTRDPARRGPGAFAPRGDVRVQSGAETQSGGQHRRTLGTRAACACGNSSWRTRLELPTRTLEERRLRTARSAPRFRIRVEAGSCARVAPITGRTRASGSRPRERTGRKS